MSDNTKVGVIAEGKAEKEIFNILLESDILIFQKEDILINNPCTTRNAKTYCDRNLKMVNNVKIVRILDSKRENFKIPRAYERKIENVINVYTRPEIEILAILSEGLYKKFKSSGQKPSTFLKTYDSSKFKSCKSAEFIGSYFSNPNHLYHTLLEYER